MQRPSGGYRDGIRMAHQHAHNRPLIDDNDDDEEQLTISNSNSDEEETSSRPLYEPKKPSPLYSKMLGGSVSNQPFEIFVPRLSVGRIKQQKSEH